MLTRILLPRSRYDEGIELMTEGFREGALRRSDRSRPTSRAPRSAPSQRDRILGYIETGRDEGARLVTVESRPAHLDKGYYVEPTLFADVDNSMTVAQEEIFGPVLVVDPLRGRRRRRAHRQREPVRPRCGGDLGLRGACARGGPSDPGRDGRGQRWRLVRSRCALRRLQGQRDRPPERYRGLRAVHETKTIAGGLPPEAG